MMKEIIYCMIAATLLSLTACDKNEEEPYVQDPYSTEFGYIKGKLNGVEYNLQNDKSGTYISANGATYGEYYDTERIFRNHYSTNIPMTKEQLFTGFKFGFSIHIAPVKTGMVTLKPLNSNLLDSKVIFVDKRKDGEKKIYDSLKQPMELRIDRADFSPDSSVPFIEGEMNGILYNEEDLNDSIIVENMCFGVHG